MICRSCGSDARRVTTIFGRDGRQVTDKCEFCHPEDLERVQMPSEKKFWIGPEINPNGYEKRFDAQGVYFHPKPEYTAELERRMFADSDAAREERERSENAKSERRLTRRTTPLTRAEIEQALRFVDVELRPLIEDKETSYEV